MCHLHAESECTCPAYLIAMGENDRLVEADLEREARKPLAIDLFCGLGGWAEGFLAEGYDVVGFDNERHRYPARALPQQDGRKVTTEGVNFQNRNGSSRERSFNYANQCALRESPLTGGWSEYPGQLVLQDVLTIHGSQFRDAVVIVASPPCQNYSYLALPWCRSQNPNNWQKAAEGAAPQMGNRGPDNRLFDACFRIQRGSDRGDEGRLPSLPSVWSVPKWQ